MEAASRLGTSIGAAAERTGFVAARVRELTETDAQFRAAFADPTVNAAKARSGMGLAQIVALCMQAYADRPALGRRAAALVKDTTSGRMRRELAMHYETVSYAELWGRARSLANFWDNDESRHLRADELIGIIAFAGVDFTTVDLAAIHNGAVVVPLQTNAPLHQLRDVIEEVAPRWLATSLECLDTAVALVLSGHRPAGLLLFDFHPEADDEREIFEAAQARLASAGLPNLLVTLRDACAQGATLPAAPLFEIPGTDQRMCSIYYTSGSTGLPKGAMHPERMVTAIWRAAPSIPMLQMHYLPMNHGLGRGGVFNALANGGTCYFAAKSDLSSLLEDIKIVRPTFMAIVPRICEMIYQRYKVDLERRAPSAADAHALAQELLLETRNSVLGGRLVSSNFGSAPLAPDLREFMQACLGFEFTDTYGATEMFAAVSNTRVMRPPVIDYKLVDVPELGYFTTDKPHPRGELWLKTSAIMLGYYKRPDVTASVFSEDGYYMTGDIMAELEPDRLVYVDRRNNVVKLAQGEFVAISRLEALYTNGHPLIHQVFLHGSSQRSYIAGVFVPNEEMIRTLGIAGDESAIKSAMRDAIKSIARAEHLNAYEVPRDFIVEHEPFSVKNGLLAGLGKFLRPKLNNRYDAQLNELYERISASHADELAALRRDGRHAPVLETVAGAVKATLGVAAIDLSQNLSFADLGGDSLSALTCSLLLEEIFEVEVPAGVISNPAGTLQKLAAYIDRARDAAFQRPNFASVHGKGATEIRASDLVPERFIDARTLRQASTLVPPTETIRTVLITGANGYLGRFLCLEWLERMAKVNGRVICIARGRDADSARNRIAAVFDSGDPALKRHFDELSSRYLEVLAGDIAEPELGLGRADWERLSEIVDLIVHPAAFVNHVLPYTQLFGPNVAGTAELIRLALTYKLKPLNNISSMGVTIMPAGTPPLNEESDVRQAMPIRRLDAVDYADGYINSKWASEVLLREASVRYGLPVAVFRCDMILAHSRYKGQINVPDMFTRWLLSTMLTGLAPRSCYRIGEQKPHYDGLPVDFIAESITVLGARARAGYRTYHVCNPHQDGISLDTFLDWMVEAGHKVRRIEDYDDWYGRFGTALRALPEKQRHQSSLPLLHQLRRPMMPSEGAMAPAENFIADVRNYGVGGNGEIPKLSAAFIRKNLDDLKVLRLL